MFDAPPDVWVFVGWILEGHRRPHDGLIGDLNDGAHKQGWEDRRRELVVSPLLGKYVMAIIAEIKDRRSGVCHPTNGGHSTLVGWQKSTNVGNKRARNRDTSGFESSHIKSRLPYRGRSPQSWKGKKRTQYIEKAKLVRGIIKYK